MSSEQLAIQVKDLSKHYFIYQRPEDRLKQYLLPRLHRLLGMVPRKYYREFKALDNINFEVKRGEAVGIIGRNGAGKSTLLQLICGTLTPTIGTVEVNGRVAALLELGSGFNPDFTGRENVYLNASVLGLTREETDAKYDEIAAFADIGDYIDQSTKTYSTGMLMRLAFAVNTCVDPDILIVDEALSVGDAPFQSKCFKRLRNLIDKGTTILFVSHDIATVRSICSRALWLKDGLAEIWGYAKDVANEYEKYCHQVERELPLPVFSNVIVNDKVNNVISETLIHQAERELPLPVFSNDIVNDKVNNVISETLRINNSDAEKVPGLLFAPNLNFENYRRNNKILGTGGLTIENFLVLNKENMPITSCEYGDELTFWYLLKANEAIHSEFLLGILFKDLKHNHIYNASNFDNMFVVDLQPGESFALNFRLTIRLTHQDYTFLTNILGFKEGRSSPNGFYDFSRSILWELLEDFYFMNVRPCQNMPLSGPVHDCAKIHPVYFKTDSLITREA